MTPDQLAAAQSAPATGHDAAQAEASVIKAVATFLRINGDRKSPGVIKDAVEHPFEHFGHREATSALSQLGYRTSFGYMPLHELDPAYFPLVAFDTEGRGMVVESFSRDDGALLIDIDKPKRKEQISYEAFKEAYSGYLILAKPLTENEREAQGGHWFFGAFRQSRWTYVQVAIAAAVSNFLGLTTAIFTMVVYDRIIPNESIESLIALSVGVVIALGFDFLIKTLRASFIDRASKKADLAVSRRLFDRILNLSPEEQTRKTGAMAGVIREFETLRDFSTSSTFVILVDLPFVFFFIYVISLVAGPLALIPLAAVPLVVLAGLGIQPFLKRVTKTQMESGISKQAVLVETLSGLETITATGSGRLMRKRYQDALHSQSDLGLKARALSQFAINFSASVQQYAQIGLIFYGVFLVRDGIITTGALIAAVILGGRTLAPLGQLANAMARMNGAITAYRSLDKLFKDGADQDTKMTPVSRPSFQGEIEFRNVTFAYPGANQPLIEDLSIKIPAGQKVALVGKMGSGKSTFTRLVAGIYQPQSGAVLLDGVDVRQIEPSDLRRNIGITLQDSWLFSGTVRENIQMGNYEYDDDHLVRICKMASVDDFIGRHPKGYDLMLREKGAGLSGGQKQAINLARSMMHEPPVLLLDEPTSSMDQQTEQQVVANLEGFMQGKTMIAVTHRNPILKIVDRVLVIDRGKIVSDSTPQQLGVKGA
jgi:ATP-binding cassette subfamily C protein LapB